jgi:hypothetical protein
MDARRALLQVLTVARGSDGPTVPAHAANTQNAAAFDREQAQWRKIGLRPFAQIKTAYFISAAMSVTLFLCGIILFVIAALRSMLQGTADSASLLIAGLGAVDFIALIYTRPLKDIASNLASTQRATMIASSYLGGLSLIDPHEAGALDRLEQLTKTALDQTALKPPV